MSTGKKNRYSSVEKLWKLDDTTLKTPKHDEMIVFLLDEYNVRGLIPKVGEFLDETRNLSSIIRVPYLRGLPEHIDSFWDCLRKDSLSKEGITTDLKDVIQPDVWKSLVDLYADRYNLVDKPTLDIDSEVPIMTRKDFLVGYWDIVLTLKTQVNKDTYFLHFYDNPNQIYRFVDDGLRQRYVFVVTDYFEESTLIRSAKRDESLPRYQQKLYIEVKPKIDSFGATLRQIRTYQQYCPRSVGNTYLFTNDLKFRKQFESQGIKVVSMLLTEVKLFVKAILEVSGKVSDEELQLHLDMKKCGFDIKEVIEICNLKRTKDDKLTLKEGE